MIFGCEIAGIGNYAIRWPYLYKVTVAICVGVAGIVMSTEALLIETDSGSASAPSIMSDMSSSLSNAKLPTKCLSLIHI